MKKLILFLSIITINSAIRVPNRWHEVLPTEVTVNTFRPRRAGGNQNLHHSGPLSNHRYGSNIQPEIVSSSWSPVFPKRTSSKSKYVKQKPKYYKKPIQQFQKKKRFSKPVNPGTHYGHESYNNAVPYITYKKSNNGGSSLFFPPRPLSVFPNVYPKVHNRPKNIKPQQFYQATPSPQTQLYYQNNQAPQTQQFYQNAHSSQTPNVFKPSIELKQNNFNPNDPKYNHDTKLVQSIDQPRYQSNNLDYEPNKKIINYFEAVKNENFTPNKILWDDKVAYTKTNEPEIANSYQAFDRPEKNQVEQYSHKENEPEISNSYQAYDRPEKNQVEQYSHKENEPEIPNSYQAYDRPEKNQVEQYSDKENDIGYYSHLYKNYRDDNTFEPDKNDTHYIKEEDPKFEREEIETAPPSTHEVPNEIPTRPIYPGEGLWAKPGLKHRPFISQQTYDTLKEDEVKPTGYDTFLKAKDTLVDGKKLYNFTANSLTHRFRAFPEQHKLGNFIGQKPTDTSQSETKENGSVENNEENKSISEEDHEEDEFVPTRLYAQVRASEDMEYLPLEEADDGKLREAIKESKIHTVYTEEGYEDSAYDHAGHEKEAENAEGFEDLQREKLEKKEKKVPEAKLNLHLPNLARTKFSYGGNLPSDEEVARIKEVQLGISDTDAAGTQFEELHLENNEDDDENEEDEEDDEERNLSTTTSSPKRPNKNFNNFISTKETKTMTMKEKDDGDTETEISSKVKIILQPNNGTGTKHQKYVKIYPKVYKTIRRKKPTIDENGSQTENPVLEQNYPGQQSKSFNFSDIFIEEVIPTTEFPFTKLPPTEYQELPEEIPITTLPTTAIPKPIRSDNNLPENSDEALEDIAKEFLKFNSRIKRFANDFADLRIEHEFVPKINHDFATITDYNKIKYPYYGNYKNMGLNIDSPLRYSENMDHVPNKTGKKMVFYEEAEKTMLCPEIEATLNPIPEGVKNAEKKKAPKNDEEIEENEDLTEENESEEEEQNAKSRRKRDVNEQSKSPRLAGLGDQIDCLKARYFGENPLDSPFFNEVTVGTIEPIFKELTKDKFEDRNREEGNVNEVHNSIKANWQDNLSNDKEVKLFKKIFDIDKKIEKENKNNSAFKATGNSIDKNYKKTDKDKSNNYNSTQSISTGKTVPVISLLTTPGYTINLKPKHIYDQIELLEYLPNQQIISNNKSATNDVQNIPSANSRQDKSLDEDNLKFESSNDNPLLPEAEELIRRRKVRRRKPSYQIFDVNKYLPTTPSPIIKHSFNFKPTTLSPHNLKATSPPILQQTTPGPPVYGIKKLNGLQVFDINKFIPTTPSIYKEIITSSTVLPKYKVVSEVFYKDDIKPNEQLNVFTDVINNIKNSSNGEQEVNYVDSTNEYSEPVSIILDTRQAFDVSKKRHIPLYHQDSYLKAYGDQEIDPEYADPVATTVKTATTTTTTTVKPTTYRGRFRYKIRKSPEKSSPPNNSLDSNDQKLNLYHALQEAKKKQRYTLNSNVNGNSDYDHTIPVNEDVYDYIDKTTKVMGLMPPGTTNYKTIHHPKRDSNFQISSPNQIIKRVNKFYVVGLKPPPHQRILVYSDFLNKNLLAKKISLRRGKRSANSYASLSRNRGQQESELENATVPDNDDDYVPHRPKNYYYDEKTGKIVYLATKKPNLPEEEEEEVEYEEVIEEPPSTTAKPKQNPIFATATPPPEGKGYIDFILKLKQNPNYKYIPDPTTTEKGLEAITEKATTTLKPQSTNPPEFLNILSKVRQSNQYKLIEDKKEKKTTTVAPEEDEENEDELEDENIPYGSIKNAPGGQNHDRNEYYGIFDVSEFIPKIKNYLPRTSYDTSKYKTISRPASKLSATVDEVDAEFEQQMPIRYPLQEESTEESTTQKPIVINSKEANSNLDSLNEATVTKQTEELPVTIKRRRPTTTTSTTLSTPSSESTEKSTTRATFLRRRRPTTLRSTRTTTRRPAATTSPPTSTVSVSHEEKIRRVFRRRPPTRTTTTTTTKYLDEEHDGTVKVLRRRSGTVQPVTTESPTTNKSNRFVETFRKFHRDKKHGGGYQRENTPSEQASNNEARLSKKIEPSLEEIRDVNEDVEIIGEYDKTKRHGGNYKKLKENEDSLDEIPDHFQDYVNIEDVTEASDDKSLKISLLPKDEDVEEIEEHTENPNIEEEESFPGKNIGEEPSEIKSSVVVSNKKKSDKDSKGKYVTEATLLRLTDVVPKPEAFYTDPALPKSVNNLAVTNPTSAEIKDILSNAESSELHVNRKDSIRKPLIIKDPSKRFYFYAPI